MDRAWHVPCHATGVVVAFLWNSMPCQTTTPQWCEWCPCVQLRTPCHLLMKAPQGHPPHPPCDVTHVTAMHQHVTVTDRSLCFGPRFPRQNSGSPCKEAISLLRFDLSEILKSKPFWITCARTHPAQRNGCRGGSQGMMMMRRMMSMMREHPNGSNKADRGQSHSLLSLQWTLPTRSSWNKSCFDGALEIGPRRVGLSRLIVVPLWDPPPSHPPPPPSAVTDRVPAPLEWCRPLLF
jgi:hypothetical protein